MRKFLLIVVLLTSFYSSTFTQTLTGDQRQELLRREIDSLKKVLPEMSGSKKVDWLNKQAYNYFSRWMHWKLEADSAYPYAMEANVEAKKIGYKEGLAYSYLRLGTCQFLGYGSEYKQFHNSAVLDAG